MTIDLPEPLERYLREAVASGRYPSIDAAVALAVGRLELDDLREQRDPKPTPPPLPADYKPIWDIAQEIAASISDEEWAKLPTDGAEQHDHYIYGTPKRATSS